jgi:hypothetical protein
MPRTTRELEELTGHGVVETMHTRDAVTGLDDVPVSWTSTFLS